MRENLFDQGQAQTETPEPAPETPAETPTETQPDGRVDALEASIANTNQAVQNLAGRLESIFAQAAESQYQNQPAQEPATVDSEQFLNELAQDPSGTIDRRAQAVVAKMAEQELTPTLTTILETTHDTLLTKHQLEVDKEFGQNTWDEVIKPAIGTDLANLRKVNYRAIADPGSIKALVDRQLGLNFKTLRERFSTKEAEDAKLREAPVSAGLPPGGAPRIRLATDEPNEDAKLFFKEVEEATGDKVDQKLFMKLHSAGNTIDDYLAVVGGNK